MRKIISLILFGLLCINTAALCKEQKALQYKKESVSKAAVKGSQPVKEVTEQKDATKADLNENDILNLDDNSFTITDEQFQEAKNMSELDDSDKSLGTKIINSSHFTVGTPSKTYNPLNKPISGN